MRRNHPRVSPLSVVAHDLKTPLTAIRLQAELALRAVGNEAMGPASRHLRVILETVQWMGELVNEVLREEAQAPAQFVPVSEYVLSAIEQVKPLADSRRIDFRVSLPAGLPPIRANRARALQILINLLVNAVEHGTPRTSIHVTAAVADEFVVFSVRDQGPGLPGAALPMVLGAAEGSPTHGLGLSIVTSRVEELGGRIWVDQVERAGTTILFTLPIRDRRPVETAAAADELRA